MDGWLAVWLDGVNGGGSSSGMEPLRLVAPSHPIDPDPRVVAIESNRIESI